MFSLGRCGSLEELVRQVFRHGAAGQSSRQGAAGTAEFTPNHLAASRSSKFGRYGRGRLFSNGKLKYSIWQVRQ
jgi:hypothetical protein